MSTEKQPAVTSIFERHLQTAMAAILIGAVGWVGVTVTGNREEIARIQERQASMTEIMSEMKGTLEARTRQIMQVEVLSRRLDDHETRLRQIEQALTTNGGR